jgi:hypothetical protein
VSLFERICLMATVSWVARSVARKTLMAYAPADAEREKNHDREVVFRSSRRDTTRMLVPPPMTLSTRNLESSARGKGGGASDDMLSGQEWHVNVCIACVGQARSRLARFKTFF